MPSPASVLAAGFAFLRPYVIRGGSYVIRFVRGISGHTAGQLAKRGVIRKLGVAYERLNATDKWIVDQSAELAARIALNYVEGSVQASFTLDQLDNDAGIAANNIELAILNGVKSRAISLTYDGVCGKIDRSGKIIVRKDIIKQLIISAVFEIFEEYAA